MKAMLCTCTCYVPVVYQSTHLVQYAEGFMTLVVTGDAGKTVTLEANLARFGIAQLARTGTVSLKRGQLLLEVTAPRAPHPRGYTGFCSAQRHHRTACSHGTWHAVVGALSWGGLQMRAMLSSAIAAAVMPIRLRPAR